MSIKHVILMYISEISGHHSATLAIEKAIKLIAPQTRILNINAFNYTNPISEKIVNCLYIGIVKRTPKVWGYLYDNIKIKKRVERFKKVIHQFNSPKLKELFERFKPDAVVCTQAFPCGMVADFKETYNADIPLVGVLTDYVPHSYWIYDTVDYYITPSEEISHRLNRKGVPLEKIKPFGIPFDPIFNEPQDKQAIIKKLDLDPNLPIILIMGGGQGLGPIKTVINSLEKLKRDIQEIVVTGSNKKLYRSLNKNSKKYKQRILAFGYINNIHELMSISEIIITKPGGITTAEALAKKLPMVIVKPLPGQEANNTQYLIEKKAAIKAEDPKRINLLIENLLEDKEKLNLMRQSAERISKPQASIDIARLVLGLS
ncbi:MAG: glycosyltransferase [Candidatus Omnitrophica bacterium]|nr:glycosyltransferase [Candidatus Omnitrophota bacterium]